MPKPATFRLDLIEEKSFEETELIIKDILEAVESEKYLISYEKAQDKRFPCGKIEKGKWHWQGVVYYNKSHESYKKKCEELSPLWKGTKGSKGQGKRSFADCTKEDNYTVYISKSGRIRFKKGYTEEELEDLYDRSYGYEEDKIIDVDNKGRPIKVKGKGKSCSKASNFEAAYKYLYEHYFEHVTRVCAWEVCKHIIKYYQSMGRCESNDFQEKCMTKSLIRNYYAENDPEKYEKWCHARAKEIIGHEFSYDFM